VSNAFFPPGFANEMETYEDEASGVTFQAGYDSLEGYQPPKVLMYDAERVLSTNSAWRALFTQTFHATALSSRNIFRKLMVYSAVAIVFIIMSPAFEADAEEAIDALNSLMAAGLFFLLGPFVVNAVQRWWDVRRNCVGALWGVVDDLSTYSASWFWRQTPADREARRLVTRLGLCSHALLYKQARNGGDDEKDELADLVRGKLLRPYEAEALAPLASKAQVVWAWQTHFWTRALSGELGTSPVPHAAMLAPLVMQRCMDGRGAIGLALAYIGTQQPFPYVHLLSILTDLALAVNAMYVGLHTGRQLFGVQPHCDVAQAAALKCASSWQSESTLNVLLLVGFAAVRVAAFTLIYHGLLGIGVSLDNPIGDDPADLPGLAFQVFMRRECEAFGAGVDAIDLDGSKTGHVWWEGLGSSAREESRTPRTQKPPSTYQEPHQL